MKVILVLDEMPAGCIDCPCYDTGQGKCQADELHDDIWRIDERPSWCPLKEMPEKRILPSWQVNNTNYGEEPWFSDGWNACLEEIEK